MREWRAEDPSTRMVIVCNNTYENCLWADILVAADHQWWNVYGKKVREDFPGQKYVFHRRNEFAEEAKFHFFGNTGAAAIAAAAYFGAVNIYLLGYDSQFTGGKTHHHGSHVKPLSDAKSILQWPAQFKRLASSVARTSRVINCTRVTALTMFPRAELEAVL